MTPQETAIINAAKNWKVERNQNPIRWDRLAQAEARLSDAILALGGSGEGTKPDHAVAAPLTPAEEPLIVPKRVALADNGPLPAPVTLHGGALRTGFGAPGPQDTE